MPSLDALHVGSRQGRVAGRPTHTQDIAWINPQLACWGPEDLLDPLVLWVGKLTETELLLQLCHNMYIEVDFGAVAVVLGPHDETDTHF